MSAYGTGDYRVQSLPHGVGNHVRLRQGDYECSRLQGCMVHFAFGRGLYRAGTRMVVEGVGLGKSKGC